MPIMTFDKYRIKRNADQQDIMQKLFSPSVKLFKGYAEILMVSAIIGYNKKKFVPITKFASDSVQILNFTERDKDIIDLIAYAHEGEIAILRQERKYEIFESYANGGFPILLEKLGIKGVEDFDKITTEKVRELQLKYYSLFITNELD